MQIRCPECELKLAADDVNIDTMVAKCTACDNVFTFADQINNYQEEGSFKSEGEPLTASPMSISVKVKGDQLILRRRWFHPLYLFGLIPVFIWNGFLYILLKAALSSDDMIVSEFLLLLLMLSPFLAFGIAFAYGILAKLLNTTTITVDPSQLSIKHAPLPWKRPAPIDSSRISQLYCAVRPKGKKSTECTVNAIVDSEHIKLLSDMNGLVEARYIERKIEAHLGIKNRPVRGSTN